LAKVCLGSKQNATDPEKRLFSLMASLAKTIDGAKNLLPKPWRPSSFPVTAEKKRGNA